MFLKDFDAKMRKYIFVEVKMKVCGVKLRMAGWVAESVFHALLPQTIMTFSLPPPPFLKGGQIQEPLKK